MKKILLIFIILIVCAVKGFAQSCQPGDKSTVINANGDLHCVSASNPNFSYTVVSQTTQNAKATAQAALQAQVQAQQQQALNDQALQEVIANQIANDPKLSAQQAVITKSLNALKAQTK